MLFIPNKYTSWYISLIVKRRLFPAPKPHEKHHILPKCRHPKLQKSKLNTVSLTYREHFIAHWLLTKMFTDKLTIYQMAKGFNKMAQVNKNQTRIIPSRYYAIAKKTFAKAQTGIPRGPMSEKAKIKMRGPRSPWSAERRAAQPKTRVDKGRRRGPQKNPCETRLPFSEVHRQNLSLASYRRWAAA